MQQSTLYKKLMTAKIGPRIQYAKLESYNQKMMNKYGESIPAELKINASCLLPVDTLIERLKALEVTDQVFLLRALLSTAPNTLVSGMKNYRLQDIQFGQVMKINS